MLRGIMMIKRAIAVTAALCMLYGSAMIPAADTGGEPVKTEPELATNLQPIATLQPIKPVPIKEENNDTRRSESDVEPDAGGHEAEDDGDSPGGEPAGQLPDSTGSEPEPEPEPSGSIPSEDSGSEPEALVEDIGSTGDAEQNTAEYSREGEVEEPYQEPTVQQEVTSDYMGTWVVTAYCGCSQCCGEWGNATASGAVPTAGHTVACNILPFGTNLLIDGIVYTVEDTGYTEYGDYWIDIYFDSHDEALAYGVQEHEVYMVY